MVRTRGGVTEFYDLWLDRFVPVPEKDTMPFGHAAMVEAMTGAVGSFTRSAQTQVGPMPQRLSGIWFKLVEPDGFYRGILMVPQVVAVTIEQNRPCRMAQRGKLPSVSDYGVLPNDISFMDFVPASDYLLRDAIMVFGISLSDLNKEPGFAFIPSADYLARGPRPVEIKKVAEGSTMERAVASRFERLDFQR